jgi:acyl-CoA synthetase (AMP-forming)/AMP-acid ligase II
VARRAWGPDLRKGDSLPLTILNMLTLTTLLTAQAQGTAVIIDQPDVKSIAAWIERERVAVWNGPPAQLHTMIADPAITRDLLGSLREVWVGGADCPDSLRASFEAKFSVPVIRTYGLTEAPALVSLDDVDGERPAGTSGRPLDHIDATSPAGEIHLGPVGSGPWAGRYRPMIGYWNQDPRSGSGLATGDLGEVGSDGHLRILGRRNQLIIRGGANVYPAEVERVLATAPGVGASAVVGIPDDRLGERVGAAIEMEPGQVADEAAILAHCRENLAAYKVPERIVFVERLPRNQMGKVPRPAVVELLAQAAR